MEKTLNILEEIAAKTRERVAEAKKKISLEDMKKKAEKLLSLLPDGTEQRNRAEIKLAVLTPEIQEEVKKCWKAVTTDTVKEYCDIDGYWEDFYHMFGFRYEDIDYTQDVDADVEIDGVVM